MYWNYLYISKELKEETDDEHIGLKAPKKNNPFRAADF